MLATEGRKLIRVMENVAYWRGSTGGGARWG